MSVSQSSLYSQGLNFGSYLQKGVDPRTGQYTCNIAIYEVPAEARNCPPFELTISYNPLTTENTGLGIGWSFSLSSYEHRGSGPRVLSLYNGESYQVTDREDLFSVNDQKLKSFYAKRVEGNYEISYKTGLVEVLSNANNTYDRSVPVLLYAPNGHSLQFEWEGVNGTPRLNKIRHGAEDLLSVNYKSFVVEITRAASTPEASTFTLDITNDLLRKDHTPLSNTTPWEFDYDSMNGLTLISKVTSPTGLVEEVHHDPDGHRLPTGAPYQDQVIPWVSSYVARPGRNQPPITTTYKYSSHNFLGYGGPNNWNNGEDNLYRARADYEYTSSAKVEGGSTTEYTYNKFHLMKQTTEQKGRNKVTQNVEYYALPGTDFKDQPAQYQLPKTVSTTYEVTDNEIEPRTETSSNEFDEWGNPTKETKPHGTTIERTYYPEDGETDSGEVLCPPDPHGFFQRHIRTEKKVPGKSDFATPTRSEHFTYRELPTVSDARTGTFIVVKNSKRFEADKPLGSTDYITVNKSTSRDHGRVEKQTTQLSEKQPTTQKWDFDYPADNTLRETITTESFDSLTVQDKTDHSLSTGLKKAHTDDAGVQDCFEYDSLGKLLKSMTAVGTQYETTRRQDYGAPDNGNGIQLATTDSKGVQARYIYDGLERLCEVQKQDIDGSDNPNTSPALRTVEERTYNAQDQCIEITGIDWLRANGTSTPVEQRATQTLKYDDWGEVEEKTDSTRVVSISKTDPITLTQTEGTKGQGQIKTTLDLFGNPTMTELLNKDGTTYSKFEYFYDGLGRLRKQEDALGRKTQFEVDSFDRVDNTTWPSGRVVHTNYAPESAAAFPISVTQNGYTMGEQSYDGLGRVKSKTVGARTVMQNYAGNEPEPNEVITPQGEVSKFDYEPELGYTITSMKNHESEENYEYDPKTGVPSAFQSAYSSRHLQYYPSGLLQNESIKLNEGGEGGDFFTQSTYSMAGKLQTYLDVNGLEYETTYDSFGQVDYFTQGTLKVSFDYDDLSRIQETKVEDTASNTSITTVLEYDDFGREKERTVSQQSKVLYKLSQLYGETGLVKSRHLEDGNGSLLRDEKFEYDEDNHLKKYTSDGDQSPADEHGRKLQSQEFDFDDGDNLVEVKTEFRDGSNNCATYAYDNKDRTQLSQITNTHPDNSRKIPIAYDDNGCLTRDEQGRWLEYDSASRLKTVRDVDNSKALSHYRYDAAGRLACQSVPGDADYQLFYRDEKLIAVQKGDSKVSYIANEHGYWGQSVQEGGSTETQLWAADGNQSILAFLNSHKPDQINHQEYTPYGFGSTTSIGFNGQWRDPVTGWYHLGNGYRVYNPVLMRFHTPDPWCPFTSGEINPYAYCQGDPINRDDPSGHGFFGWIKKAAKSVWGGIKKAATSVYNWGKDNWKTVGMVLGIAASIAAGIATAGMATYITVGVNVAVGAAMEVGTGVVQKVIDGEPIKWQGIVKDAVIGAASGLLAEGAVRGISAGISKLAGGAAQTVTKEVTKRFSKATLKASTEGALYGFFASQSFSSPVTNAVWDAIPLPDDFKSSPSGQSGAGSEISSSTARDVIRPALRDGESSLGGLSLQNPGSGKLLGFGVSSGAGTAVAGLLNLDLRCTFDVLGVAPDAQRSWGSSSLESFKQNRSVYNGVRWDIRKPH